MSAEDEKKRAALDEIADILKKIEGLYKDATVIAEKHGVAFDYRGPAGYGDSGSYYPRPKEEDGFVISDESDYGFRSSSQSC